MIKNKRGNHLINREWCKGCGVCVMLCPKQVLEQDRREKAVVARHDDCIFCKLCEIRCPDLAIEVIVEKDGKGEGNG